MNEKRKSLIINNVAYNDVANIITAYSLENGRESYVFYRGRGKNNLLKSVFLQPFTVLDLEIAKKKSSALPQLKEIRQSFPLTDLLFNPIKSSIAVFLAELLYKVLRDTSYDRVLFSFLENSVRVLDLLDKGVANFHLVFSIQLTRFLGYYPNIQENNASDVYFDMENGIFTSVLPMHTRYLSKEDTAVFIRLLNMNYDNMSLFQFSRQERVALLRQILNYYYIHSPEFRDLKSLSVLQDLFD